MTNDLSKSRWGSYSDTDFFTPRLATPKIFPEMAKRRGSEPTKPAKNERNKLYYGDNLEVMRKYLRDETVDLCYMDPPFNSNRSYNQIYSKPGESHDAAQAQAFIDTWEWDTRAMAGFKEILENAHARFSTQLVDLIRGLHRVLGEHSLLAYLVGMSLRLVEIHRILKTTGSFYLHCDPTASHYLKIILDAIYGEDHFLAEIVWKRYGSHGDSKGYGAVHDIILYYGKTDDVQFNKQFIPYTEEYDASRFRHVDQKGRRYQEQNLSSPSPRPNLYYPYKASNGVTYYPHRNGWKCELERMQQLDKEGRLHFPKNPKGRLRLKMYRDECAGVPLQDVWTDVLLPSSSKERLGYPTQKPLSLLERIILASSNEGDVVFDPCCGCGTTVAAADLKNRKWIGIDITYQSIALVLQRLEDQSGTRWHEVEQSIAMTGIPRDMASAVALAHKKDDRVRKEFEKWAVLTYTSNRGRINEKRGADAGIDGRVHFMTGRTDSATMIFQVKSGVVHRDDIAKLRGDMEKDGAALATLITLTEPTAPMVKDARAAGLYHHELMDRDYDRIQIVTIQEILDGTRLDIPLLKEFAVKKPKKKKSFFSEELTLPGLDGPSEEAPPQPIDMIDRMKGAAGRSALKRKGARSAGTSTDIVGRTKRKPGE